MKTKEVFLIIVAFTLMLTTFCVVTLTASYTEKSANEPVRPLSNDSGKGESNNTFIRSSGDNLDKTAKGSELKSPFFAASNRQPNNRPGKPKTEEWSADRRVIRPIKNGQFKLVKSNGREYFENTTGSIASNDDGEDAIKSIE